MRRASLLLRFSILLLVGGVAVAIAAWLGPGPRPQPTVRISLPPLALDPSPTPALAEVVAATASTPTPPTPTPTEVDQSPVARLRIPAIEVDAPVVVLGVDANGAMESPATPTDVAWYDFSAHPGSGGNAVFAAHVDYHDYGAAVFWSLRELRVGDEVDVVLEDGAAFRYAVVSSQAYDAASAPIQAIVGPTEAEVVTLITCDGSFDSSSREYDSRLVIRAQRVPNALTESP